MGGKSWTPYSPVRVSETAGEAWRSGFPKLALFRSYRRAILSKVRPGNVEVTDRESGVTYCVDADSVVKGGWVIKTVKAAN